MQKFSTLSDAIALAEFAHRNQLDKAGLPYIDHPKRVLAAVQAQGALPYVQIAAVLHDVTEDTPYTPQMLLTLGFSEAAVQLVELVDRNISATKFLTDPRRGPEGKWANAIEAEYYYLCIREDPAARMVKMADIEDNLSPWRQSYLPEATQIRLANKYAYAKLIIDTGMSLETARQYRVKLGI